MTLVELALIVVAFGAMAIVFGAQERAAERRALAWAEETLSRIAAETHADEPTPDDDAPPETPAPPPLQLVDAA